MEEKNVNLDFLNIYSNINRDARPPKEAYLYFPCKEEIIDLNQSNDNKIIRRIFDGNLKFHPVEKEKILNFKEFIKNTYKEDWYSFFENFSDKDILRFHQSSGYDNKNTLDKLLSNLEWKKMNLPVKMTKNILQILNSGLLYIYGRDNRFRPIIIFSPEKFNLSIIISYENLKNSIIYLIEYCIQIMLIPGQIENINLICDLQNFSLKSLSKSNLNINDIKDILKIIMDNYKFRLHNVYLVNLEFPVKEFLELFKNILNEDYVNKIKVIRSSSNQTNETFYDLFTTINRLVVENKFGGMTKNLEKEFFPPRIPETNFMDTSNGNENENILISPRAYMAKITLNTKIVRSPHVSSTQLILDNKGKINIDNSCFNLEDNGDFCSSDSSVSSHYESISSKSEISLNKSKIKPKLFQIKNESTKIINLSHIPIYKSSNSYKSNRSFPKLEESINVKLENEKVEKCCHNNYMKCLLI